VRLPLRRRRLNVSGGAVWRPADAPLDVDHGVGEEFVTSCSARLQATSCLDYFEKVICMTERCKLREGRSKYNGAIICPEIGPNLVVSV
jgi:hypothetical protein